jgi:hypothetical protein
MASVLVARVIPSSVKSVICVSSEATSGPFADASWMPEGPYRRSMSGQRSNSTR